LASYKLDSCHFTGGTERNVRNERDCRRPSTRLAVSVFERNPAFRAAIGPLMSNIVIAGRRWYGVGAGR
jgi:hypothetical protein